MLLVADALGSVLNIVLVLLKEAFLIFSFANLNPSLRLCAEFQFSLLA